MVAICNKKIQHHMSAGSDTTFACKNGHLAPVRMIIPHIVSPWAFSVKIKWMSHFVDWKNILKEDALREKQDILSHLRVHLVHPFFELSCFSKIVIGVEACYLYLQQQENMYDHLHRTLIKVCNIVIVPASQAIASQQLFLRKVSVAHFN